MKKCRIAASVSNGLNDIYYTGAGRRSTACRALLRGKALVSNRHIDGGESGIHCCVRATKPPVASIFSVREKSTSRRKFCARADHEHERPHRRFSKIDIQTPAPARPSSHKWLEMPAKWRFKRGNEMPTPPMVYLQRITAGAPCTLGSRRHATTGNDGRRKKKNRELNLGNCLHSKSL